VRTLLAENIYEEDTGRLSGSTPHTVLYHRFANAIGVSSADLEAAEPLIELKTMMEWFAGLIAQSDWVVGACAFLYGLESQKPGSRERRLQAVRETYRIAEDALTFFIIHIGLDDEHGDVGARIVLSQGEVLQGELAGVAAEEGEETEQVEEEGDHQARTLARP
jgi:pyrroloquinoline-quinone synthase